jgi:hypothetical protein
VPEIALFSPQASLDSPRLSPIIPHYFERATEESKTGREQNE